MSRLTRRALAALPAALLLACSPGDWLADQLTYHPAPGSDLRMLELGIEADDVWLRAEDGVRLHGFWLPAPDSAARALLYLHGNAGNASHRLPRADALRRLGLHVLLLDYRGYGRSEGQPDEPGLYRDARAGLAHLERERRISGACTLILGRSLGGAVAVDLAQERALGGLVLESTFSRAGDVAAEHYGALGSWLAGDRFDSLAKIAALRAPLLQLHGDRDRVVPFALGRALFAAAPDPKTFVPLPGAGHNDDAGEASRRALAAFVQQTAARCPEPAA